MIALYVILGIFLFLFLLLLIPLRFDFRYGDETELIARYLFLKYTVLPEKEKPKKKKSKPPAKKPAAPPKEKEPSALEKLKAILKKKGASGFLILLREIATLVSSVLKRLFAHVRIKKMDIYFVAGGEDAADAALLYGQASGVIYPAVALFSKWGRCKNPSVSVDLDYERPEAGVSVDIECSILPFFLLKEALTLLVKGLPYINEFR